ncbi:MAG: 6,7-dimethyl-8-ribityllumazine synthase [Rhodospirillales bacterium]|nr:6,7-dimethyl-8-ribityllumazine synthase [Rhodospirillales bacterium]
MPHFMIVEARYYEDISDLLLRGATAALEEKRSTFEIFQVPGALEIPLAMRLGMLRPEGRGAVGRQFDGYIALGCVLRGETSHYDIVCNESARGLSTLALEYEKPIGNGILTCENEAQALERADPDKKNKGGEAALAALSMVELKIRMGVR